MNKVHLGNCTLNSKYPLLTRGRAGSKVGEHCPSLFSLTELSFSKQERTLDFTSISQTMLYKTLHKGIYLPKRWRRDMYRWQKEIVCQLPIPRNIISYISWIYLCYTKRTDMRYCITFYSINILEIFFFSVQDWDCGMQMLFRKWKCIFLDVGNTQFRMQPELTLSHGHFGWDLNTFIAMCYRRF